jgi:hypothetical protein
MQTHYLPDCKRRGKLQEKEVQILGTGSVFTYGVTICKHIREETPYHRGKDMV